MRIDKIGSVFVVRRGASFFGFFVDSDSASFTTRISWAQRFASKKQAEECLTEIRKRNAWRALAATKAHKFGTGS